MGKEEGGGGEEGGREEGVYLHLGLNCILRHVDVIGAIVLVLAERFGNGCNGLHMRTSPRW